MVLVNIVNGIFFMNFDDKVVVFMFFVLIYMSDVVDDFSFVLQSFFVDEEKFFVKEVFFVNWMKL